MVYNTLMLFLFILTMMTIVGAVPVLIVYIGNKSRNDNTRLGSSEKILQLEQRIEELENELKNDVKRRLENVETIVTEKEYLEETKIKMIDNNPQENEHTENLEEQSLN